jgi:hypothetical protein
MKLSMLFPVALSIVFLSGCAPDEPELPARPLPPDLPSYPFTELTSKCWVEPVIWGYGYPGKRMIVGTKEEYDSVWYRLFQRPLDDYWNENYELVLDRIRSTNPGLSDSQYTILVSEYFHARWPFLGRDSCLRPDIDFDSTMLLGMEIDATGCTEPDYHLFALTDSVQHNLLFLALVEEHGWCEPAITHYAWILIPRLPEGYGVTFDYIRYH